MSQSVDRRTFRSDASDLTAGRTFPWLADGLVYGADYNPEQWPEEIWPDDVRLMNEAGVTTVSLGIFSWGLLEVDDGVFDFGWLDRILELLHSHGIGVNLATPTAAPPIWLLRAHPEILPIDRFGHRQAQGARLGWCPSSPLFRERALAIVRAVAERYGDHPALRLWHVSNEIGNENARCYCELTAAAFQTWLAHRYQQIENLNQAWGTAFWGHHYRQFGDVLPPAVTGSTHNPALVLDFDRFSSDELLAHYLAERDLLRTLTPGVPITTNFMVNWGGAPVDYRRWAHEVDLVANDHYTAAADPHRHWELAMSADRVRGMSGGRPWLLMEHSTSAVNWQPRNRAKPPGELIRDSITHLARGADGLMFFQWRQSTAGSEQFHSAMVPHAGTDTKVWREVTQLGALLKASDEITGSTVEPAQIAMIFDYHSMWALRAGPKPSVELDYLDLPKALHRSFTRRHRVVDVIGPDDDLDRYRVIIVPTLYLASQGLTERLRRAAENGAQLLISYFSGIADQANRVIAGGYPGAYRELIGGVVEEFHPLLAGESCHLDNGWEARIWTEHLRPAGAEVLASYVDGDLAGVPAITRHSVRQGSVTYLATRLGDEHLQQLADSILEQSGVPAITEASEGMQVVRRVAGDQRYLFAINHTDHDGTIAATGHDLLSDTDVADPVTVPAGQVVIIKEV